MKHILLCVEEKPKAAVCLTGAVPGVFEQHNMHNFKMFYKSLGTRIKVRINHINDDYVYVI